MTNHPRLRHLPGFSIIELLVAAVLITMIASVTLTAISNMKSGVFSSNRDQAESGLETQAYENLYTTFSASDLGGPSLLTSWHVDENEVFGADLFVNTLLAQSDRSTTNCRVASVNWNGSNKYVQLANETACNDVLEMLDLLDLDANPIPVFVNGAIEVCSIRSVDPSNRRISICPDGGCPDANAEPCLMSADGESPSDQQGVAVGSMVFLPRYNVMAATLCRVNSMSYSSPNNVFELDESCADISSKLSSIGTFTGGVIDADLDGIEVDAVNTRHVCTTFTYDAGTNSVSSSDANCTFSGALGAASDAWYLIVPVSKVVAPNVAKSYLIEPLEAPGAELIRLSIERQYYADFDNDQFDQGTNCPVSSDCRVPVQQGAPRLINTKGRISIKSESLPALQATSTLEISVIDKDEEDLQGKGQVSLPNPSYTGVTITGSGTGTMTLVGNATNINSALLALRYAGPTDTFDNQRIKFRLSQNDYLQETGSGANDVHPHLSMEVWPNCGCEDTGLTALNIEVGQIDNGVIRDDGVGPSPIEFTSVAVTANESAVSFYGLNTGTCNAPYSGITCSSHTRQQIIANPDAIVAFVYEEENPSGVDDKYSFIATYDAHYKSVNDISNNNNNDCATTQGDRWRQIVNGHGTKAITTANGFPQSYVNQWGSGGANPVGNVSAKGCKLIWTMFNIVDTGATDTAPFPLLVEDDPGEYNLGGSGVTNSRFTAKNHWSSAADGLVMALPITIPDGQTLADTNLSEYELGGDANPTLQLDFWQSVNKWRIRTVRPLPASNCSESVETDNDAWLDVWIHSEFDQDGEAQPLALSSTRINNLADDFDTLPMGVSTLDEALQMNARDGLTLKVKTAKTCPDLALFADP